MTIVIPQCFDCRHFERGFTCAAYPTGIPQEILINELDHRFPLEADHDIQFAPLPGEEHYLDGAERLAREGG